MFPPLQQCCQHNWQQSAKESCQFCDQKFSFNILFTSTQRYRQHSVCVDLSVKTWTQCATAVCMDVVNKSRYAMIVFTDETNRMTSVLSGSSTDKILKNSNVNIILSDIFFEKFVANICLQQCWAGVKDSLLITMKIQ